MARTLAHLLARAAAEYPRSDAIIDDTGHMSYAELYQHARAAASLVLELGLGGAGEPVIVTGDKSARMLAVCLGILLAGGSYVPVDAQAAPLRLASIFRVLDKPLVIAQDELLEVAQGACAPERVHTFSEALGHPVDQKRVARAMKAIVSSDPAYVLFTSGSTGTPKGVIVSHRSVLDFISSFTELFGIDKTDVIANQAPFDFDVSVKDIYSALATGATLLILPRRLFSEPAELIRWLDRYRVTTLTWAVAALCLLTSLHALDSVELSCVRRVLFSGETMPLRHLATWLERLPQADFYNLYGPTEVTCNCLYHPIDRSRDYSKGIPLGEPFPDHEVFVVDEQGSFAHRAGEIGELYVKTPQLALGYIADKERTDAAFVQNPLQRSFAQKVYRTGDLVRISPDGELIFFGRRDNQIKHLGHRIELEEIDLAIERFDEVERCRCAYDEQRHRILAFFEGTADANLLAQRASDALPAHMAPGAYIHLDSMPLTKNGKVDRRALLAHHAQSSRRKARP